MSFLKKSIMALTALIATTPFATAHDAGPGSSAVLHILSNGLHFSGFLFIGVLVGLFVPSRRLAEIWSCMDGRRTLLSSSSDSHVPLIEPGGIIFAIGFLSAGFIMFIAGNAAAMILRDANPNEKSVKKE